MDKRELPVWSKWTDEGTAETMIGESVVQHADEVKAWLAGERRTLTLMGTAPEPVGVVVCADRVILTSHYAVTLSRAADDTCYVFTAFPYATRLLDDLSRIELNDIAAHPDLRELLKHSKDLDRPIRFEHCDVEFCDLFALNTPWADLMQLLMAVDVRSCEESTDVSRVLHAELAAWTLEDLFDVCAQTEFLLRNARKHSARCQLIVGHSLLLSQDSLGFSKLRDLLRWLRAAIREHLKLAIDDQPDKVWSNRPSSSDEAVGTM